MASLQKNVASQKVTFCLVDSSTGAAKTTATFTASAWVTVDGSQAGFAGTFTTLGNGQYQYAPTQGETNGTDVGIFMAPSGAVPVNLDFHTDQVDANGLLKVDVEDIKGTASSGAAGTVTPDLTIANSIETGLTLQQALRLIASTTGGKLSGGGTGTETFRNAVADSANRVIATVDSAGNRSAITYSL